MLFLGRPVLVPPGRPDARTGRPRKGRRRMGRGRGKEGKDASPGPQGHPGAQSWSPRAVWVPVLGHPRALGREGRESRERRERRGRERNWMPALAPQGHPGAQSWCPRAVWVPVLGAQSRRPRAVLVQQGRLGASPGEPSSDAPGLDALGREGRAGRERRERREGKEGREGEEWKERRGGKGRKGRKGRKGWKGRKGVNWMPVLVPGAVRVPVMGRPVLLPIDRMGASTGCPRKGRK